MKGSKDKDLSLMDRVHAYLFQKEHRIEDYEIKRAYRTKLRQAQRFVLDDDTVHLICNLSHELDRMMAWSFLARLPYDVMWIEFSLHEKLKEFARMNTLQYPFDSTEVAERMGYLMYREDPGGISPRWICHVFTGDSRNVLIQVLTYVFDPEGNQQFPVRGSSVWNKPSLSLRRMFPPLSVMIQASTWDIPAGVDEATVNRLLNQGSIDVKADAELLLWGVFDYRDKALNEGRIVFGKGGAHHTLLGPEWLAPRMAVIVDPWWDEFFDYKFKTKPQEVPEFVLGEANENRGHLRWIVTLLAAMNGIPRAIKPAHVRTGKRMVGMYQLPYFDHHNLSLTVPREERVLHARRMMDKVARNTHNRWHQVIGHWRVIEYGKSLRYCRHIPTMVEHGVGMCERCELLVRWIPAHERGDATLGIVNHTYTVKIK